MLAVFFYLFGAQTVLIVMCCITSFLISRNPFAPTTMYRVQALGFLLLSLRQMHTLSYANTITKFLESQDKGDVFLNQAVGCAAFLLIAWSLIIKLTNVKHYSDTRNELG
jgi:hypothetical protein